jgi:hypothetical protein
MEERPMRWRDLPGRVNLRDFVQMVTGEIGMIAESTQTAFQALRRLPFGPLAFVAGMLMVLFRLFLLALVIVFFGGAIVVISIMRVLSRKRSEDGGG